MKYECGQCGYNKKLWKGINSNELCCDKCFLEFWCPIQVYSQVYSHAQELIIASKDLYEKIILEGFSNNVFEKWIRLVSNAWMLGFIPAIIHDAGFYNYSKLIYDSDIFPKWFEGGKIFISLGLLI